MNPTQSTRGPKRRADLTGWRAFVDAAAPSGVSVNDIADGVLDLATRRLEKYGPVVGVEIREGRRFVSLVFSFPGFHQTAEMAALTAAAPIFAHYGMAIDRVEMETCEP